MPSLQHAVPAESSRCSGATRRSTTSRPCGPRWPSQPGGRRGTVRRASAAATRNRSATGTASRSSRCGRPARPGERDPPGAAWSTSTAGPTSGRPSHGTGGSRAGWPTPWAPRPCIPAYPLAPGVHGRGLLRGDGRRRSRTWPRCRPAASSWSATRPGVATRWRVAEALRDRGGAQPDRLVLIAPWVDLTSSTPGTLEAAKRDPWLSYPHLAVYASFWAGSEDAAALADPRVSPVLGDLAGLPPALMFCGTRDLLQPGCDALFERADEADWPLEYVVDSRPDPRLPAAPDPRGAPGVSAHPAFCRAGERSRDCRIACLAASGGPYQGDRLGVTACAACAAR